MGAGELQGAQPARHMAVGSGGADRRGSLQGRLPGVGGGALLPNGALDGRVALLAIPPQGIEPGSHVGARPPPFARSAAAAGRRAERAPCARRAPISGRPARSLTPLTHALFHCTLATDRPGSSVSPHAQDEATNQRTN